jgi:hypothetical protein
MTRVNYKKLCLGMLEILAGEEERCIKEGYESIVFARNELSSFLTKFEKLSHDGMFNVKACVSKPTAELIIRLFQALYDNNYYILENWKMWIAMYEEEYDVCINSEEYSNIKPETMLNLLRKCYIAQDHHYNPEGIYFFDSFTVDETKPLWTIKTIIRKCIK